MRPMAMSVGQRVELQVDTEKTRDQLFEAEVVEIDRDHIVLTWPTVGKFLAPIRANTHLSIGYLGGTRYLTFDSVFVGAIEGRDGERLMSIEAPSAPPVEVDQRKAPRISFDGPVTITVTGGTTHEAVFSDLSTMGAGIVSPVPLDIDSPVAFSLSFTGLGGSIPITATVRRNVAKAMTVPKTWLVGLTFDNLAFEDESRLRKFVIERQRQSGRLD